MTQYEYGTISQALARTVQEWRDKVAASGARSWPEWIGKTGDTEIPEKVKSRVVMVWGAVCYLTGVKIIGEKPQYEHVVALSEGGENREGNIRPVWATAHKEKSKEETNRRAKANAQRAAAVVERPKSALSARHSQNTATRPLTKTCNRF